MASTNRFRALSSPSGNVVALGAQPDTAVNCAGQALVRVYRGDAEVLGFRPRRGVYYSLHSPKWGNLLVLRTLGPDATSTTGSGAGVAPFSEASAELLSLMEPMVALSEQELETEESAVDDLAAELADAFPVVLVFRAIPVTFGNVMSFFEGSRSDTSGQHELVLPGFKMVVPKYSQTDLRDATIGWDAVAPPPPSASRTASHDWKSPERVLAEFAVVDALRVVQITDPWRAAADALESSLVDGTARRIVVCGAKGVGKSTFCRYLLNRLLVQFPVVAFLDTDLGQSELTPPGMVSLHALATPLLGPGFSHMRTPVRAFFCGGANPGNDPLFYMQAVKSLLRLYGARYAASEQPIPLIVNTDGWIKSMGHDLLCSVIQEAAPDHVVQLLAATKSKQFDVPSGGEWRVRRVEPWDPTGTAQSARSSKDMRLYRLHTYFLSRSAWDLPRAQLQNLHVLSEKNRVDGEIARAYARLTPFAVSFDQVDVAFAGSSVPPSQLLFSLNASLVGLCINVDHAPRSPSDGPPRIVLGPVQAPCLGVGIVRAIDIERRVLFVVTPLPIAVLQRVNLLVRSAIPLDALMVSAVDPALSPYVVTDVVASKGTGSAAMQSRNNLKRKRDGPGPK